MILAIVGGIWLYRWQASKTTPPRMARTEPQSPVTQQPPTNNQPSDSTQTIINSQDNSNFGPIKPQQPITVPIPEKPRPSVFTIALVSGQTRDVSGRANTFKVPAGTQRIQLRLELNPGADDYPVYQAALETGSGQMVLGKGDLRPRKTAQGKIIVWEIDASHFLPANEDYYLKLSGRNPQGVFEAAGAYSFKITKK